MIRPLPQILTLWLIGVLAAAQLAKFAVAAPILRVHFGLSLAQAGLLISLLEIGGALFGLVAGLAVGRLGARRLLIAGSILLAGAGVAEGWGDSVPALFAARAVEGIGYLLIVIAAPTLIVQMSDPARRSAALALWSTFVPVGMALGSAVTGLLLSHLGFRAANFAWSAASLLALVAALRMRRFAAPPRNRIAMPRTSAWFATIGFGFYTIFVSVLTALLPTFLIDRTGATIGGASVATGLASLAALPGAAVAVLILRNGRAENRAVMFASATTLLATMFLGSRIFAAAAGPSIIGTTAFAVCLVALSGVASAVVFARLPAFAGARSAADNRIASANGLVTQFGAGGALVGPPLGALAVETWGWHALGWMIAASAAAMLGLVLLAEALCRAVSDMDRAAPPILSLVKPVETAGAGPW